MPKKARHSLSNYRLLTGDMGYIIPCGWAEILPGDRFYHSSRALMRLQPLLKPLMHPINVEIHHWFVPWRLLWSDFEAFITRRDPALTVPTIDYQHGVDDYTLLDHLGVPQADNTLNVLPVRAYNLIYNDRYRDQNIHDEVDLDDLALKRGCWDKDYFTTARTEPQFGDAAIDIPFASGTNAPIIGRGGNITNFDPDDDASWDLGPTRLVSDVGGSGGVTNFGSEPADVGSGVGTVTSEANRPYELDADAHPGLFADLSSTVGGGINVNDFRAAIQQQMFLEHRNRFGSRYEDLLRFYGVRPSDARLQQPEYLGGGKNTVSISEVLSHAGTTEADLGALAGHGISGVTTRPYRFSFPEHGIQLSLLIVRPRTIYMQQLHRTWLRREAFDFWQKELEGMGPQEIFTKELYGLHADGTTIFGYNGRHDEYRSIPSYVSGAYRVGGTESDWHMARDFSVSPALNEAFLDCVPTERVYADSATPEIYVNVSHKIKARRLVSRRAKH